MRRIIKQFRLSTALEDRHQPAEPGELDQEAAAFAHDLAELDRQLKSARPGLSLPAGLHDAIMARVRESQRPEAFIKNAAPPRALGRELFSRCLEGIRPWAAPAFTAVLVLSFFAAVHLWRPQRAAPAAAKPQRDLAVLPGKVLSPLSAELENLDRDLKNTADFLLASVP